MKSIARAACLVSLSILTGCGPFDFAEQDIGFSADEKGKRWVFVVDTRGLSAPGAFTAMFASKGNEPKMTLDEGQEKAMTDAVDQVRAMADGARFIYLLASPFIVDLDKDIDAKKLTRKTSFPFKTEFYELSRNWAEVSTMVEFSRTAAYVDDHGGIGVHQRFEVPADPAIIDLVNRTISYMVLEEFGKTKEAEPILLSPFFNTAESKAKLLAYAKKGGPWVELDEEGVTIRVPVTPTDLALMLKGSLAERREADEISAIASAIFHSLEELEFDDGIAVLRFPFDKEGWINMSYTTPRKEEIDSFAKRFGNEDLPMRSPSETRALLTAPR